MNKLGLCARASVASVLTMVALTAGCSSSSSSAPVAGGDDGGSGSSSGGSSSGGAEGGAPTLAITGVTAGESIAVTTDAGASKTIAIPFTLSNFTLMAAGTCPGGASNLSCGHIHVLVDGSACTPSGSPYDNQDSTGSPAIAILSTCPMVDGAHTVTLELHNDVHAALMPPVSASVMITATGG
jgi:hypothetical protein